MKFSFILFILITINLFAEDIYLKNGTIYLNVKIIERNENFITITINEGKSNILISDIDKIVDTPYNPNITGTVKQGKISYITPEVKTDPNVIRISQKHLLIVSVLSGLLAWDSFVEASQYPKGDDKTRKTIIGVLSAAGCVAALYFSFQDIEIKVKPDQLQVSYGF